MSESKQKYGGTRYPHALKLELTKRYLSESISYRELSKEYNIDPNTIRNFVGLCKQEALRIYFQNDLSLTRMKAKDSKSLEKENARLREELKLMSLKAEGYEYMLRLAGKEYGADLLKKVAAKQSDISKKDTKK